MIAASDSFRTGVSPQRVYSPRRLSIASHETRLRDSYGASSRTPLPSDVRSYLKKIVAIRPGRISRGLVLVSWTAGRSVPATSPDPDGGAPSGLSVAVRWPTQAKRPGRGRLPRGRRRASAIRRSRRGGRDRSLARARPRSASVSPRPARSGPKRHRRSSLSDAILDRLAPANVVPHVAKLEDLREVNRQRMIFSPKRNVARHGSPSGCERGRQPDTRIARRVKQGPRQQRDARVSSVKLNRLCQTIASGWGRCTTP